jgi:hypothetical protein
VVVSAVDEDPAFSDDPVTRLGDADPARVLPPHPSPWRLREQIILENQPAEQYDQADQPHPVGGRWAFPVAGALLGVAALVAALVLPGGGAPSLPTIRLGAPAGVLGVTAEDAAADAKASLLPTGQYRFVLADGLTAPAAAAPVWRHQGGLWGGDVAEFAGRLGVAGPLAALYGDPAAGFVVGADDFSGARLEMYANGYWWFSNFSAEARSSAGVCEAVVEPERLADEVALDVAGSFLAAAGLESSGAAVTYADGWASMVEVPLILDGQRTSISSVVSVSSTGAVLSASGFAGRFDLVGEYPLVSLEVAIGRLGDSMFMLEPGHDGFAGYEDGDYEYNDYKSGGYESGDYESGDYESDLGGGDVPVSSSDDAGPDRYVGPMVLPVPVDGDDSAWDASWCADGPTSGAVSVGLSGGGLVAEPGEPEDVASWPQLGVPGGGVSASVNDPSTSAGSDEVLYPVELVVELVAVELEWSALTDADGAGWLVPQFVFTDTYGGRWWAPALPDEYLDFTPVPGVSPEPGIVPGPEPGIVPGPDPVDWSGPVSLEVVAKIVGLGEVEAVELLESAGLVWRVIARDGEWFMVTKDFSPDRVNLTFEAGVVTDATLG